MLTIERNNWIPLSRGGPPLPRSDTASAGRKYFSLVRNQISGSTGNCKDALFMNQNEFLIRRRSTLKYEFLFEWIVFSAWKVRFVKNIVKPKGVLYPFQPIEKFFT